MSLAHLHISYAASTPNGNRMLFNNPSSQIFHTANMMNNAAVAASFSAAAAAHPHQPYTSQHYQQAAAQYPQSTNYQQTHQRPTFGIHEILGLNTTHHNSAAVAAAAAANFALNHQAESFFGAKLESQNLNGLPVNYPIVKEHTNFMIENHLPKNSNEVHSETGRNELRGENSHIQTDPSSVAAVAAAAAYGAYLERNGFMTNFAQAASDNNNNNLNIKSANSSGAMNFLNFSSSSTSGNQAEDEDGEESFGKFFFLN